MYATIFATFGLIVYKQTGYLIYTFMDCSKKENIFVMASLYPIIFVFNSLVVILDKIKIIIIRLLLKRKENIPISAMKKKIRKRKVKDDKSFPEMSFWVYIFNLII